MPTQRWTTVEDLRPHLDPIVGELERLPSQSELRDRKRCDLLGAIQKFGGYRTVAERLDYPYDAEKSRRPRWHVPEDLRPHLDPIVAELGQMPSQRLLRERGRHDLINAIGKFGGLATIAETLGYSHEGRHFWDSVEDLRSHLDPIVAELGRMPTLRELATRRRADLINAIRKFGGLQSITQALGYPYQAPQTWTTVEDLRLHLVPIVTELGRMPSVSELTDRRRDDLRHAIQKFGGMRRVAAVLDFPWHGYQSWDTVEDLRPHLGPIVAQLGRMPSLPELSDLKRDDLHAAVKKFGGGLKVAETLGYPYAFAAGIERYQRFRQLESALAELHNSQLLTAGQVMVILRHAGLLSLQRVRETVRYLHATGNGSMTPDDVDAYLKSMSDGDGKVESAEFDELPSGEELHATGRLTAGPDAAIPTPRPEDNFEGEITPNDAPLSHPMPGRDRVLEVKELRGWSHVGNLIDPAPALVQLSVTRLKIAFYGFANQIRGSLEASTTPSTTEEVERLKDQLWEAAFGEYGDLIDNDLVREACETYLADLASALLLPRHESEYIPRLYQLDGGRFIADRVRSDERPYGLLFDQPGMGKTLTTLWGLAAAGAERVVIVAPLTVKREVWTIEQIRQAFPDLEVNRFATGLDAALALPTDGPALAVLHYEELRRHSDILTLCEPRPDGSRPFDAIVLDEAHEVKVRLSTSSRGPTRTGAWILRQGARACIGLTATPVVNELFEPVSLLHLAQGRRDTDAGRRLRSRRLRDRVDVMEYLLADSLRRLKPDVLFEIPPREILVHEVVPDASQLARLEIFLSRGRRAITAQLAEYRRLSLEAKLDWVTGIVQSTVTAFTPEGLPDPKTLVLCYNVEGVSRSIHERLATALGADRVLHVDGSTPEAERKDSFRRFRKPADAGTGVVALVGSVGTVGVGVTLFDANEQVTPHRVVFADLPYTWAEFEQGVDRLHRVGQQYPVRVDVPLVTFGEQLVRADGEPLQSFDQWVWDWIRRKQVLADQVLDAAFDISEYKDAQIRKAIATALKAVEESGGAVIAPAPPAESAAAEHRREIGRLRGMPRQRAAERFEDPAASQQFLAANDTSVSARLAQRLVRERLSRWLDRRSVIVDLGCGSHPLRDLPCARVIGIDRHGVNGGLVGDSADTGLPAGEADFVVMSLSMWGTPEDRLAYLLEAKRLLRPIGKLVIVEPLQTFGGLDQWKIGAARLAAVLDQLGMNLVESREYAVDAGTQLLTFVIDNSATPAAEVLEPHQCAWNLE